MLNDKFNKILELEQDILQEETNLPLRKEQIIGEYRTKAQQEIAAINRNNETLHEENIQSALDRAESERESIFAKRDEAIEFVSKQYEENREQVITRILSEVMNHGNR